MCCIKGIKKSSNVVKQISLRPTIKIDWVEDDVLMVINFIQPAAAICFLAFSQRCLMPFGTENIEDGPICTDGNLHCKVALFNVRFVL